MKFIFADSLDFVDPKYDFLEDRPSPLREPYWDDQYPHEILGTAPYDGILVSKAVVGGVKVSGKYTDSQAMRFERIGAREFLRFPEANYPGSMMVGDCGAFSYHAMDVPPYSPDEMIDFYGDGGFTHGCSVDHIIFDHSEDHKVNETDLKQREENLRRYEITLKNAEDFLKHSRRLGNEFTPMGVVQGWSPGSMAQAALRLQKMGYKYLAIGGMVPLQARQILSVLEAIRTTVGFDIGIHILGFAKADEISIFSDVKITSFDSTSPLIRAFKDSNRNYFLPNNQGSLDYYSAIRIPQSIQNNTLKNLAKEGAYSQEDLQTREMLALDVIRNFSDGNASLEETLEHVMNYSTPLLFGKDDGLTQNEIKKMENLRERYTNTLTKAPWKKCPCKICKTVGIEVIIFRSSNRNKRRGFHNLYAYQNHIKNLQPEVKLL